MPETKSEQVSILRAHTEGAEALRSHGIADPRLEAGSLLAHALDRDRTFVITHRDDAITPEQLDRFQALIKRRTTREPLQYIVGHQEFFELDFEVTPDVLIPRPETEIVVEAALELMQNVSAPVVCDVGTGSGCIAISLLHKSPAARGVAIDISDKALHIAERNAIRHSVIDRLKLTQSDLFDGIDRREQFSLIVSNPPYVAEPEIETLPPEVRDYEPLAALMSGPDGLSHIRRLLRDAPAFLPCGGYLIFEIGFEQHEAVKALLDPNVWTLLEIRNDLQNIPRSFLLQKR